MSTWKHPPVKPTNAFPTSAVLVVLFAALVILGILGWGALL